MPKGKRKTRDEEEGKETSKETERKTGNPTETAIEDTKTTSQQHPHAPHRRLSLRLNDGRRVWRDHGLYVQDAHTQQCMRILPPPPPPATVVPPIAWHTVAIAPSLPASAPEATVANAVDVVVRTPSHVVVEHYNLEDKTSHGWTAPADGRCHPLLLERTVAVLNRQGKICLLDRTTGQEQRQQDAPNARVLVDCGDEVAWVNPFTKHVHETNQPPVPVPEWTWNAPHVVYVPATREFAHLVVQQNSTATAAATAGSSRVFGVRFTHRDTFRHRTVWLPSHDHQAPRLVLQQQEVVVVEVSDTVSYRIDATATKLCRDDQKHGTA